MSGPVSTTAPQQPSPSAPTPQGGKRWKIVAPVVAVLVLVAAGAGAYLYHHAHAKPKSKAHTPAVVAKSATFTLPQTLDGLPKSTDEQTTALASAALADLSASITDLRGQPVLGAYGATSPNAAIIVGLPGTPTDSEAQISNVFDALRSTQFFNIPDPTAYPTGQAGSMMECADASLIGGVAIPVGACVESDSGGSVLLLRLTKTGAQTADIMKAALPTFEKR